MVAGSWPAPRSRNVLKRDLRFFAAAFLMALASSLVGPSPALAAAPQHRDQVPGFYRMKVGDFEVTALFDGAAKFELNWLTADKLTTERIERALREDPHLLDIGDTGFLINTGKELVLVDAGAGTWFG